MDTSKIRPLYEALQGLLAQAPDREGYLNNDQLINKYHGIIDQLISITDNQSYDTFRIVTQGLKIDTYRAMLNAIIMSLHGEYFYNEREPFSGNSQVTFNQEISQYQYNNNINISHIQDILDKKIYQDDNLKSEEKEFITKLKEILPMTKDVTGIIAAIVKLGIDLGIDINSLKSIFT